MKLWGGRFAEEKDKFMKKFDSSFPIDQRLWKEDITGSIAHVSMLRKCEIIDANDADRIIRTLQTIQQEIESGILPLCGDFEDIHSFIEYQVVKRLGAIGKKMHTARSRNDQVAVDTKLFVKTKSQELIVQIDLLRTVIENKAVKSCFAMPGYTHLQRGQIVTFKYHLMAYHEMFGRDIQRINNAISIMNTCPLGSGALAGSTYEVDRHYTSAMLGFDDPQPNTMDSVSDRDYIIELLSAFSILMMHMSRFCEEMILYSTKEFDFIHLSDAYSTGSSLMPQKKNPDSLELIRGKTGRVYASLIGMLTVMKGLPLTYNKDMQEDKSYFFESYDTVSDCVQILQGVISSMEIHQQKMHEATLSGFLNATELADYLVRKGTPFREAHEIVGHIVSYCEQKNCEIHDLDLTTLQTFCEQIDKDVYLFIHPDTILNQGNKIYML